jgi:hypothetical protein
MCLWESHVETSLMVYTFRFKPYFKNGSSIGFLFSIFVIVGQLFGWSRSSVGGTITGIEGKLRKKPKCFLKNKNDN